MDLPTSLQERFNPAAAVSKTGQARSERDELLDLFLAKINPDRAKKGMDPISHSRLARMLSTAGYDERSMHGLYKSCERARSFGGLFWHLMHAKV